MSVFLILAFLFFIGSVSGWILELFYRRFISSANPERKWINPGFCTGPYLPLYGTGLCILYLIASLEKLDLFSSPVISKIALFASMAICMTAIEYLAGILSLKVHKIRLWDYRNEWANIQGIICPKFSFYWSVLGAMYYFLIHPHVLNALTWLSENLAFSFVIGLFFGVFLVDVSHSAQIVAKLRKFASDNDVILHYEKIKLDIRTMHEKAHSKYNFFKPFHTEQPFTTHLKELVQSFEKRKKR